MKKTRLNLQEIFGDKVHRQDSIEEATSRKEKNKEDRRKKE